MAKKYTKDMDKKPYSEEYNPLIGIIRGKFQQSETSRLYDEKRWLKSYRNYRGLYGPEMAFRDNEKSKVFVKVTKTKVLASFGQIIEVLFSGNKFPIGVESTPVPEGIAEKAFLNPQKQQIPETPEKPNGNGQDLYGFAGDGKQILPGATAETLMQNIAQNYEEAGLEEGEAPVDILPEIEPARLAAEQMQKVIHDQLDEIDAIKALRHVFFEMALLGTGVLKGPFTEDKLYNSWQHDEELNENIYIGKIKSVPQLEPVSCWDLYPDPNAASVNDCDYIIQRHSFNRQQLVDLLDRPFFKADSIRKCLDMGPNYATRGFESSLYDRENVETLNKNRYEVLEYWGSIDKETANNIGFEYDDSLNIIHINAWICGNQILRIIPNPFIPYRLPYMVCPYEINPYQFFGVGIPENMEDSQQIMNGHARMAIDNLALAGNLVFDVDEASLVPGQNMDIFPGKIFRRQSGVTGTAINGLKFPNTAPENLQMYMQARQLADEETGIPSIMHGQTGVSGTGRTAAGLSMLMGGANLSIKTVMKNIDDFLLKPLGE